MLFLLPFAPQLSAAHGGGRVIAQFLAEVIDRYQVAIVYLRSRDEPGLDDFFRERCALAEEVIRPVFGKTLPLRLLRYRHLLKALIQLRPLWVADWASKTCWQRANLVARRFQPHIVQVEYHVMGQYLSALDGCDAPRVLVAHEPGARAAPYLRNLPPLLEGVTHKMEQRAWQRYETTIFGQVQAIVAFTEADRQAIKKTAGRASIAIIPPGFTLPERPLDPLGSRPPGLLFIGNFIHPPNVEAAMRLIHSILPAVQVYRPDVTLTIVGDQPPPEMQKLAGENVVITGRVADTTPFLDRAALFVAPVFSGGGIRIKVLEALAAGKAVVATPLAAEGLDLVNGQQIYLAEADDELARQIVALLADPEKQLSLATEARAWACDHLGWDRAVNRYEALYARLLADATAQAASRKLV